MPRGRKAASETQQAVAVREERVPVPDDLTDTEAYHFATLINSQPAGKYNEAHLGLLKGHARTMALADQAGFRINFHLAQAEKDQEMMTPKEQTRWTNLVNTHLGLMKSLKMTTVALGVAPYERKDGLKPKTPTAEVWDD